MEFLTNGPGQTKKVGEVLAKEILKTKLFSKALIIGLEGDLGGGKTTFLQGFAKGLGIKEKILSPTFVILKKFKIQKPNLAKRGEMGDEAKSQRSSKFKNFYHIDCYRIKKPREILNLGFKEIVSNPKNIITVEWANRIRQILPKNVIILKFQFIDNTTRKITIKISKKL